MKGGFSFCGVDISTLGLEYAPELEDTYVYRPAQSNIYEETFDGHNGGYYYGTSRQPKEFILKCAFEENVIDKGFLTKIQHLFKVGKSGKLIFKRRPWCYYYATITDFNDREITNYMNGIITITMKAYYPYARCDYLYSLRANPSMDIETLNSVTTICHDNIMANTALYDTLNMAPPLSFTNLKTATSIIIGNPGTERASVAITASGNSGTGVIIENKTTHQKMRLVAISEAVTTNINKEVRIDGISGKTLLVNTDGTNPSFGFLYHDYGFIELEPNYPAIRNVFAQYTTNNTVTTINTIEEDLIGTYVYIEDRWHKIVAQPTNKSFIIDSSDPIQNDGKCTTTIMSMNELEIRPETTMNLSKLTFSFKPTFA